MADLKPEILISPQSKLQLLPWKELWAYRSLIALFVRRDFVSGYKQTILGPLWFVIPPLIQTFVFTLIFGRVAKIDTGNAPQSLFFMSGVLVWNFFATTLSRSASTFTGNAGLFEKVYFPRLSVAIAGIINNFLSFAIQFLLFVGIYLYYGESFKTVNPTLTILLAPLVIVQLALLGLGAGCLVTSLTTRYRDFAMMLSFGIQLWMYGSCVVYPLSAVPQEWHWFLLLNPVVPVVETFRFAFFGDTAITLGQILIGWVVTLVILVAGLLAFHSAENSFVDTV
ncbi:MAG: ABC transporter permease [Terrimicrobiaceae bacterium]